MLGYEFYHYYKMEHKTPGYVSQTHGDPQIPLWEPLLKKVFLNILQPKSLFQCKRKSTDPLLIVEQIYFTNILIQILVGYVKKICTIIHIYQSLNVPDHSSQMSKIFFLALKKHINMLLINPLHFIWLVNYMQIQNTNYLQH